MISQEQTNKLTRMFGLEWVDYIEEIEMDDLTGEPDNLHDEIQGLYNSVDMFQDHNNNDIEHAVWLMNELCKHLVVMQDKADKWDEHVSNLQEHGGV